MQICILIKRLYLHSIEKVYTLVPNFSLHRKLAKLRDWKKNINFTSYIKRIPYAYTPLRSSSLRPILSNVGVTSTSSLVSNSSVFKSSDNTRLDDIFRFCFSVWLHLFKFVRRLLSSITSCRNLNVPPLQ